MIETLITDSSACDSFAQLLPFFRKLWADDADLVKNVEIVAALVASSGRRNAAGEMPSGPPAVSYVHEVWVCQTPPAEVLLPDVFSGTLLWGGQSPALATPWLLYRNVVLVVNCIGKIQADGRVTPHWTLGC